MSDPSELPYIANSPADFDPDWWPDEDDEDWMDRDWIDEYDDDEDFFGCCDTPGCIMPGSHFRDECHTARDMAYYYADIGTEPVHWSYREPFYGLTLLWRRIRYRDEVSRREWYHHLHVEWLPRFDWLRPPRKCSDCGRRWRDCPDDGTCLPF